MRFRAAVLTLAAVFSPLLLAAQQQPVAPAVDFSGIIFGNFQFRTDSAAKAQTGGKSPNKFELDRIYLTFRMPAGDRNSIRVTTDIFQNTTAGYYAGWVVRVKYGYLQRELSKSLFGVQGLTATARVGMLHNVVIDHEEVFWPRYLGTVGQERNGFFSSSDMGAAGLVTLPNKRGEVYITVVNGNGYTAAETDRFKDFAARVSLTPFANGAGLVKSLAISPWYYKGASASSFILGGAGQVGRVSEGLQKDRRGLFVGLKDRRITASADFSQRVEGVESGTNTAASPRVVTDRTSQLASVFGMVRPMEWVSKDKPSRWSVLARMDRFKIDNALDPGTRFTVVGLNWDVNARSNLVLNLQSLKPTGNGTTIPSKIIFVHWKAEY